jgi:hypothetical protein
MQPAGKILFVFGLAIVGLGLTLTFFDKISFLGKLPGDVNTKRESFQFSFPITSSVISSIVFRAVLWLISHFKGK